MRICGFRVCGMMMSSFHRWACGCATRDGCVAEMETVCHISTRGGMKKSEKTAWQKAGNRRIIDVATDEELSSCRMSND